MASIPRGHEDLLTAGDAASFELFYCRYVEQVLRFFARRTRDPRRAAELTAETFALALAARGRYRAGARSPSSWLFAIAMEQLVAARAGHAEPRGRRRLGMEHVELSRDDIARIERLAAVGSRSLFAERLVDDRGRPDSAGPPSGDFVGRLRLRLREVAEREDHSGGAGARRLIATPARVSLIVAFVAATAAAGAAVLPGGGPEPVEPRGPRVVARLALAPTLGTVRAAFGTAWLNDRTNDELLRVDPPSRRIIARIPALGGLALRAGAESMWALQSYRRGVGVRYGLEKRGPLVRIDPRTNRVVASVPLLTPDGERFVAFDLLVDRRRVWVAGPDGALRVDPRTNRATKAISFRARGFEAAGFALRGRDLWALTADRRLRRFDARTGAPRAVLRAPRDQAAALVGVGDALLLSGDGVARVEPWGGRVLWRALRGQRVGPTAWARGRLWVQNADARGRHDRLSGLDPRTGEVVADLPLRDFSFVDMAAVGDELWLTTPGGKLVVVRP